MRLSSFILLLAIFLAIPAHAQPPSSLIPESGILGTCNFITGSIHFDCLPVYVGYLAKFLLGFAGGFFMFGIMIAGYKYMFGSITAAGLESGKKEIIGRLIGFVIIIFAYLLVDTIIWLLT